MRQAIAQQREFTDQFRQFGRIDPVRVAIAKVAAVNAGNFISNDPNQTAEQCQCLAVDQMLSDRFRPAAA